MKLQAYPRTKPSGVEWLGDVPEHWATWKFAHLFRSAMGQTILKEEVADAGSIPVLSATEQYEIFGYLDDARVILNKGDLVIPARGSIGYVKLVRQRSTSTQTTIYAKPITNTVHPEFAFYFLDGYRPQLFPYDKTAIPQLTVGHVSSNPFLLPPILEQLSIAAFLDRETGRVDRLVAKKRELIERLKEKRTALISRTVTRGLPAEAAAKAGLPANPPLKPSGIEWLGDIPKHWEVKAIKWESPVKRGASPRPIDDEKFFDDEGEYAWVRIADVTAAGPFLEKTEQRMSPLGSSLSVKLKPGALFLSIAGTVGKPCITLIKCCIHDGFVYFPSWKGDTKFLFYIFASGEPYKGLGKMGTQLNLNTDTVGSIKIGLPALPEQAAVAAYLDLETAKLDALVGKVEEAVERLQEYRTALITAAVTGKIDVRKEIEP